MSGTVGSIGGSGGSSTSDYEFSILCDSDGAGNVTRFLRRYSSVGGIITTVDTLLDGVTAYAPVGTVKVCDRDALPLDARMTNVAGGAAATTQNIAALIPVGKTMVSLSLSVLAGTANLVDFAGTAITALPVGFSANWSADASGNLNYPVSVTAAIKSRVVLVYTLR